MSSYASVVLAVIRLSLTHLHCDKTE